MGDICSGSYPDEIGDSNLHWEWFDVESIDRQEQYGMKCRKNHYVFIIQSIEKAPDQSQPGNEPQTPD